MQREVALVVVLCIAAIVLFAVTRSLAEWSRDTNEAAAVSWYDKGHLLLLDGKTDEGVAALRKAAAADRTNVEFTLALARALSDAGQVEEAWQILVRLREVSPEDTEINYHLARLAMTRGDDGPELAVRYYNHALYGVEPDGAPVERRQIQTELAELLLDLNDVDSASALLSVIARDLPDTYDAHVELARLYQRASDGRQALSQYEAALAQDAEGTVALLGAADTAFANGDFALAEKYFADASLAGAEREDLDRMLAQVGLVVANDPLVSGLSMSRRVTRLTAGLEWAAGRLASCAPHDEAAGVGTLVAELEAFRGQPAQDLRDTEVLTAGVALISRVNIDVRTRCGETDTVGEAWTIIQRARGAGL